MMHEAARQMRTDPAPIAAKEGVRSGVRAAARRRNGGCIDGYEVREVLGHGGMGVVLRAHDPRLRRDVALKLVHPHLTEGDDTVAALVAEAQATAAIRHPHVVTVYGVGRDEGRPYIAMELLEGGSLEERLREGPLPIDAAIGALREIALGLAAIHEAGRLHGDVKPSNVLLDRDGRHVLTDMGLSKRLGAGAAGSIRGTPAYVPPERMRDAPVAAPLQLRQDVYSFGVMAVEMLTGRLPFDHDDPDELVRLHVEREPPLASALSGGRLPRAFDAPLRRALRKRPLERTPSPLALVEELEAVRANLTRSPRRLSVLVADDDADWRGMLSVVVAKRFPGAVVRAVPDGRTALEQAAYAKPDIALVDVNMPGLNGIELTHALREIAPADELPIVVMSGEANGADWKVLRALGADRFFAKPVVTRELCDAIARLTS